MSHATRPDRCCCDACEAPIAPGDRVYYRGSLVFCRIEEADAFDRRTYRIQDRQERRDRARAMSFAIRNHLLRAG
jgi:hypothetical protein